MLGRIDDLSRHPDDAAQIGWALRRVGCNVNFAPTVDINSNPDNPVIGTRSFGVDAERVAAHSAAWTTGLQATGVAASAKHFPGHGDTAQDSHLSLPVIDRSLEELRSRELRPFAAAIAAGTRLVMTSHILLPQLDAENPATMSRDILIGLLREELGFSGVIVSDALDMAGASAERGVPGCRGPIPAGGLRPVVPGHRQHRRRADRDRAGGARRPSPTGPSPPSGSAMPPSGCGRSPMTSSHPGPRIRRDGSATPGPADERELVEAIDVQPAARTWRARPSDRFAVVRLEARPNSAVGPTAWGPFAEVARDPASAINAAFAAHPQLRGDHRRPHAQRLSPDESVLVVGRDIHRHAFARAAVDQLRQQAAHVLVVDMGWPSDDRRYADVATFGSSTVDGPGAAGPAGRRGRPRPTGLGWTRHGDHHPAVAGRGGKARRPQDRPD